MSYYKYLYSGRERSNSSIDKDNTYTYIILTIVLFLLIAGLLFYAVAVPESDALRNERIRRRELENKFYM